MNFSTRVADRALGKIEKDRKVKKLQEEIQALSAERYELRKENNSLAYELFSAHETCNNLEKDNSELKHEIEMLRQEVEYFKIQ